MILSDLFKFVQTIHYFLIHDLFFNPCRHCLEIHLRKYNPLNYIKFYSITYSIIDYYFTILAYSDIFFTSSTSFFDIIGDFAFFLSFYFLGLE